MVNFEENSWNFEEKLTICSCQLCLHFGTARSVVETIFAMEDGSSENVRGMGGHL